MLKLIWMPSPCSLSCTVCSECQSSGAFLISGQRSRIRGAANLSALFRATHRGAVLSALAWLVSWSTSGGTEADAGKMSPTIVEDSYSNQVIVTCDTGVGLLFSCGIRQLTNMS